MYQNFLVLAKRMKKGNYYAQFGALHTDIKHSFLWDFPSLAHRLNYFQESPVKNGVLTVSRYFRKMQSNYKKLGEYEHFVEMMDAVQRNFSNQIVICSMVGKNSPFRELSQTFQYILIIDEELEKERCD